MCGFLLGDLYKLFDSNFCARYGATRKSTESANVVGYNSIACGVDCVITTEFCAGTSTFAEPYLSDNNLSSTNLFTTKELYAKALAWTIVNIFGCTASFNM
jgi:hypothetical protein